MVRSSYSDQIEKTQVSYDVMQDRKQPLFCKVIRGSQAKPIIKLKTTFQGLFDWKFMVFLFLVLTFHSD